MMSRRASFSMVGGFRVVWVNFHNVEVEWCCVYDCDDYECVYVASNSG